MRAVFFFAAEICGCGLPFLPGLPPAFLMERTAELRRDGGQASVCQPAFWPLFRALCSCLLLFCSFLWVELTKNGIDLINKSTGIA